jgi:hypothetical protein
VLETGHVKVLDDAAFLVACSVLLVARALSAATEPFSFVVPEGFVDIPGESKPTALPPSQAQHRLASRKSAALPRMTGVQLATERALSPQS